MNLRHLPQSPLAWLILLWAIGGVCVVIANPVVRLAPVALEALQHELSALQWAVGAVWLVFMGYAEGYRGFHRQFAPRVVVRALELANRPTLIPALLGPLTAMGLIHATRKRTIVTRSLLVGIVLLVWIVRQLPQPWRGVIDAGVVLGLGIGLASIMGWFGAAMLGHPPKIASDMADR